MREKLITLITVIYKDIRVGEVRNVWLGLALSKRLNCEFMLAKTKSLPIMLKTGASANAPVFLCPKLSKASANAYRKRTTRNIDYRTNYHAYRTRT